MYNMYLIGRRTSNWR